MAMADGAHSLQFWYLTQPPEFPYTSRFPSGSYSNKASYKVTKQDLR